MNRPTLIPGLTRVWRGPTELQLGSDPARAVVLRLPSARTASVLDLLDGTRPARAVLHRAAELGVAPDDAGALLDTLHAAGLALPATALLPAAPARPRLLGEAAALALSELDLRDPARRDPAGPDAAAPARLPAQTLRRRESARVVISGRGRLGAAMAVALAESGVGHVHPDVSGLVAPGDLPAGPLLAADVGRPRHAAIHDAVLRAAPGTVTHALRRHPADLVVQLDHDPPVALVAAAHGRRRQPHLAVTIRDGVAVIGPLVPATGRPCLHCLDLHRRDRDAGWPGPPRVDVPEPCAVTTVLAATAFATAEVLTFLDARTPGTLGASVELSAPGRTRRRTWLPHPACPCATRRLHTTHTTRPPDPPK